MQIDLWASKRTPAELRSKIDQLNSMYRMKVDTALPPVRYEEVAVDPPHLEEQAPPVPKKKLLNRSLLKLSLKRLRM